VPASRERHDVVDQLDFPTLLHEQVRAPELEHFPGGARTVLHGGCAGSWYFEWFEECYPSPEAFALFSEQWEAVPPVTYWPSGYLMHVS
jgi:hypothetical protein